MSRWGRFNFNAFWFFKGYSKFAKKILSIFFLIIILHESVGGQTTKSGKIDFKRVVMGLGYKNYLQIKKKKEL